MLRSRGAASAVGDVLRWGDVPPMFSFDDPDGNRFYRRRGDPMSAGALTIHRSRKGSANPRW